jgi:hypothetical protein
MVGGRALQPLKTFIDDSVRFSLRLEIIFLLFFPCNECKKFILLLLIEEG